MPRNRERWIKYSKSTGDVEGEFIAQFPPRETETHGVMPHATARAGEYRVNLVTMEVTLIPKSTQVSTKTSQNMSNRKLSDAARQLSLYTEFPLLVVDIAELKKYRADIDAAIRASPNMTNLVMPTEPDWFN